MKSSPINRSDPEVIREWQRRGVEAAREKARKRGRQSDRRRERDDWEATVAIRVEPPYVTPIVPKRVVRRISLDYAAPIGPPKPAVVRQWNGHEFWHPPMVVAPRNKASAWPRVRREALEAAGGRCQAHASPDCQFAGQHVHHVLPRGRGGKDNGSTPLLVVCFVCHEWIHGHPYAARERGWLV